MDRATSLLRRIYVLAAVCAVLVAVLALRPSATVETPANERLAPAFPPLDVAKVRALEVERTVTKDGKPSREAVRLVRSGPAAWQAESHFNYPADAAKVEDFLKKLSDVRVHGEPTSNPAKFASFAGADGWIDVRVFEEGDAPVLSFGLGKTGAEGSWQQMYLRIDDLKAGPLPAAGRSPDKPAPGRIVAVSGMDPYGNRTELTAWVDARLFPAVSENDLVEVAWTHGPKSFAGRLERGTKGEKETEDPWTLSGSASGKAKAESARQMAQAFAGILFASLEGKYEAASAAKYGFDAPDLDVTAKGRAPAEGGAAPEWRLVVGKKVDGKATWYARRALPTGEDPWVFTVQEWDVSRYREDPKNLLDAPPPPPAEAGMGEGAGAMGEVPAGMGEAPAPPAMGEAPPPAPPAMGEAPPPEPAMGEAPPAPPAMDDGTGAPAPK